MSARLTDAERTYSRVAVPGLRGRWYSEASVERILADRFADVQQTVQVEMSPKIEAHIAALTQDQALADECNAFSALLDGTYPPGLDGESHRWRRVAKVSEEAGEVIEALLGCVSENPRKGASHTLQDVYKELLDVAFCALAACAHLNHNHGEVVADLTAHASATHARLRRALLPEPETSEGGQS